MAKKKVAKKTKKAVKRKVKKKTIKRRPPKTTLAQKIARIRNRVPFIEPVGECTDKETGEVLFRFTEAQDVFNIYRAECKAEGLIYRPYCAVGITPVVAVVHNGVFVALPFCIEDIKTGEIMVGWGSGMGSNADWSGNTANTRALKQFLLTIFQATWKDPEHTTTKQELTAQVMKALEDDGTLARIEQMKHWTDSNVGKGKTHVEESTGKKHSTSRKS